jgi:Fic family protein
MMDALGAIELFMHDERSLPALLQIGLVHAQFETIHPFLDGNGRVARLLITFLLCQREILSRPLLYLSHFLKIHRAEYYDRLMAVRVDGHWEQWLKFFLRGVAEVSESATSTAREILALQEKHRRLVTAHATTPATALRLLDYLFQQPLISVRVVERELDCAFVTANKLVEQFIEWKLLDETTGGQRNRQFEYKPYLALFSPSAGEQR